MIEIDPQKFNTSAELLELKVQTKLIKKRRYHKSRLDRYKGELILLRNQKATIAELQRWLRKKRIKVEWSTVFRWMKKNG